MRERVELAEIDNNNKLENAMLAKELNFIFEYKGYKFPIVKSVEGNFLVDTFYDSNLLFADKPEEIQNEVLEIFRR